MKTRRVDLTFIPYYAWSNRMATGDAGLDTFAGILIASADRNWWQIRGRADCCAGELLSW